MGGEVLDGPLQALYTVSLFKNTSKGEMMQLFFRRALTVAGLVFAGHGWADPVKLTLVCNQKGKQVELCKSAAENYQKETKGAVEVTVITAGSDSNVRLAYYQQLFAAESPDVDVITLDVIMPGLLAPHLLDLKPYVSEAFLKEQLPVLVENDTVDGRLVALPWYVDIGLLYYRKDLLEKYKHPVPQTWEELTRIAQDIMDKERAAGNSNMWGFVFQGRSYEGLTCDALEWVTSYGGGTLVDENGKVTIDSPETRAAFKQASEWVGKIAPQGVLNYDEESSRGVFQSGQAVFMRNWPYAWQLANAPDSAVSGKVGITLLPQGTGDKARHTAVLGGGQLAVSKYSQHPKEAAALAVYLADKPEQKRRAQQAGYHPTVLSLYEDADLKKATPHITELKENLTHAVVRPAKTTKGKYPQVSTAFWTMVYNIIGKKADVDKQVVALARKLNSMSRQGRAWE